MTSTDFVYKNAGAFYTSLLKYKINTPLRIAHFLGQIAHESANFTASTERISYKDAQARYQNHKYLGNKLVGDGYRFRGRGLIQLTGRANYEAYKKYSGVDIVSTPSLAERLDISIDIACWYWTTRKINQYADKDSVLEVSKKINGVNKNTGLPNGLQDRNLKTAYFKESAITLDVLKKKNQTNL
jgi:putative chitinase